ncbi:hypothetical protein PHYPSEUDO_006118 [Phytophthora pseudosyringae]|uniref:Protein kinase domain-containing protein n=1 Tax=Phytophthora pseudosyringae TaxID=221518 RepID=A0A8T1WG52_9STRA|nr:hypothetical protein PHYPSEUDO_006118 [Phytophthora pseudosyringae]
MPEIESEEMVSQLSGNTQTALAIIFLIWVTSTSCSTLMNKTVAPQRRKASAPGKCRIGGGALDESLTNRTRRARRLDNALEDARMNAGYSVFHTPRLARGQRLSKPRSDNATGDQLQDVYDRIEQRNNVSTLSPARIPTLSPTQLRSAEQAVQVFVDRMRHAADAADDQAKFALTRALANDLAAFGDNVSSRLAPPLATARQQNHEAHVVNELDDVACWYSLGKEIGRGTFGRVRVATHRLSGTPVAVKSYARLHGARSCLPVDAIGKRMIGDSAGDALEWRRVRQEVNVLSRLRAHPNVMRFVEVFETTSRIHVVTELVRGTSLCEVLRRASGQRLTETRAKRIFQQLLEAVEALHAQSVIHRDLKLENILLDEGSGHATVIDFGFSDFEESAEPQTPDPADNNPPKKRSKKKNFCGTPSYMAPEVVASERITGRKVSFEAQTNIDIED